MYSGLDGVWRERLFTGAFVGYKSLMNCDGMVLLAYGLSRWGWVIFRIWSLQ